MMVSGTQTERESTRLELINSSLEREVAMARSLLTKVTGIREKLVGPTAGIEGEAKKSCNPNCLLDELEDKLSSLSILNSYIDQELNKLNQTI